jgi:putative glutamine amidotransferase
VKAGDARPLIAVTTSEVRAAVTITQTPQGDPARQEMALGLKYLRAIELAGGIPVVVPPLSPASIEALLDRVDGLCLSGGPDLDPVAYGERRHMRLGPVETELDTLELALTRAADAREVPILAICRGQQVLNISRGGTLHQHLPDVTDGTIDHRQTEPGERPTHGVRLREDSQLGGIVSSPELEVNSFHHQAIARLGDSLLVTGHAGDGTIESIEASDREFVIGVQWHAECLVRRPEQAALFDAFVDCARRLGGATGWRAVA